MMTKCQKRASIQGLWLLSMVLLASSSLVCASMAVDGQTKEDINATSVTSMNMTRSSSASYNMTGGGGELNRGPCVVRSGFYWCQNIGYPTMSECLKNCES
ncbi:uncharacterized protein LOC100279139 precursor [Zea mays]|uniref:Uncharacterized protein n=2 Tax=Zea mays TaxID=4577 RepID=B6UGS7_MAIZE|nr:uncharacterized protein LOC100279139 precursor [Zea mays]ACG48560.1 hypothetical protein [Zea mays]